MLFYRIVRPFVTGIPRVLWRVRVVGLEHVPASGGFILAPSHRSMMDIPFAAIVTKRRDPVHGQVVAVRGAGARHACSSGSAGFRSSATAPTARRCASRWPCSRPGEVLCVYPEGTRQTRAEDPTAPARRGVLRAAVRRSDHPDRDRGRRGDPAHAVRSDPAIRSGDDRRRARRSRPRRARAASCRGSGSMRSPRRCRTRCSRCSTTRTSCATGASA